MRPVVLAWWNRKLRNDPSAFLCFDSHSSNRYCPFSRREKSAQAKARVVVVSRFPRNTLVLDCSFKELPSTFLWLPNEGHRMIGLHRRTSYSGRTWGEYGSSLIALPAAAGSCNLENPSWAPSRIRFRARPSSGRHKRDTLPASRSGRLFSRQSASYPWDEGRRLPTSPGTC